MATSTIKATEIRMVSGTKTVNPSGNNYATLFSSTEMTNMGFPTTPRPTVMVTNGDYSASGIQVVATSIQNGAVVVHFNTATSNTTRINYTICRATA